MVSTNPEHIQVCLTLFYGQLLAVAVYDLIIHGSSHLSSREHLYFNITRIVLGVFMILCSIFSIVIIWQRRFKALIVSAVWLLLILITYLVIYTVYLTYNFDKLEPNVKHPITVEFSIKAFLIVVGLILTCVLTSKKDYLSSPLRSTL